MYKASQEAAEKYAADLAAAAERDKLLDAARAADVALREAEARRAPVTELHRLAKELDAALTAEAERLLTLRENHRMNRIPEVPREPAV